MTIMLDIIGSMMVRGMIILIVLRMNVSLNAMIIEMAAHSTLQQRMAVLREIMVTDFEALGLNVAGNPWIEARNHGVRFLADIDGDGTPEEISYRRGRTDELSNTPNPSDRYLYRSVNGGPRLAVAMGITKIDFVYYERNGAETTDESKIRSFKVVAVMQDSHPVDGRYASTFWEQTFYPQNL